MWRRGSQVISQWRTSKGRNFMKSGLGEIWGWGLPAWGATLPNSVWGSWWTTASWAVLTPAQPGA